MIYTSIQSEDFAIDNHIPFDATLPSQETYNEIEELGSTQGEPVSLRAAPPGGTPIGGVPLGDASALTILIPLFIYLALKRRKSMFLLHRLRKTMQPTQ